VGGTTVVGVRVAVAVTVAVSVFVGVGVRVSVAVLVGAGVKVPVGVQVGGKVAAGVLVMVGLGFWANRVAAMAVARAGLSGLKGKFGWRYKVTKQTINRTIKPIIIDNRIIDTLLLI
jgi:hypothetical protein